MKRQLETAVIVLFLVALVPGPAAAVIRYVAPGGVDTSNDCSMSASPCATVGYAVEVAASGEEVRVAAGTYSGTSAVEVELPGGVLVSFTQVVFIDKSVTVRGGYTPSDWTTSDPEANPTVIDALGAGRCVTVVGGGSEVVTLEGLRLQGGDYTGLGNPEGVSNEACSAFEADCGGGLYVNRAGVHLVDSVVSGNVASTTSPGEGGGIYLWRAGESSIESTVVTGNGATQGGGGLAVRRQYFPLTIRDSTFISNTAGWGGGIGLLTNIEALMRVEDTQLVGNSAESEWGGGMYARLTANGEILRMERVRVEDNAAWGRGKGVHLDMAGAVTPQANLTNVLFAGNGRVAGSPEAPEDAVLGIGPGFTGMEVSLRHVTAAGNAVDSFLYMESSTDVGEDLTVTATNTLLTGFTNGFVGREPGGGELVVTDTNTLLYDVMQQHLGVEGTPTFTAVGTVMGDPLLDAGYRLQVGSAAIDAGVEAGVTSDLDGQFRPQGTAPDIGADEYSVTPTAHAGPDRTIAVNAEPTVLGEVPAGSGGVPPYSYQWTVTPDTGFTLSSATEANPTFTGHVIGSYSAELVVTDSNMTASQPESVAITVVCPTRLDLSGRVITQDGTFEASEIVRAEGVTIQAGTNVVFVAGERVELGNQFGVESGALFTVVIDAAADCQ